jgi:hypothetical protein
MTYHMRDMKRAAPAQPPETLTDALLALACAAGAVVLWLLLGAVLTC